MQLITLIDTQLDRLRVVVAPYHLIVSQANTIVGPVGRGGRKTKGQLPVVPEPADPVI